MIHCDQSHPLRLRHHMATHGLVLPRGSWQSALQVLCAATTLPCKFLVVLSRLLETAAACLDSCRREDSI